jgi:hypothetical protein
MKVLFISNGMHPKNLSALQKYNIELITTYNTNLDSINLSNFDIIYSPCSPIDVSRYPLSKFIFGPHFSVFPDKNQMDLIWIVWDLFLKESETQSSIIQKVINSLLNLFTLKYTSGCQKKRKYILYFVISILCENINFDEEIIRDSQKSVLSNVLKKIDSVYKQIKKNEESPGTEYLFKDSKAAQLEKTIEKLEKMNSFGETFIPRV